MWVAEYLNDGEVKRSYHTSLRKAVLTSLSRATGVLQIELTITCEDKRL